MEAISAMDSIVHPQPSHATTYIQTRPARPPLINPYELLLHKTVNLGQQTFFCNVNVHQIRFPRAHEDCCEP